MCIFSEEYWNYKPYTTEGTEFYVTFMQNAGDNDADGKLKFYLYASTRNTSDVTVTVINPLTGWETTFTCNSNKIGKDTIPNIEGYLSEEDEKMKRGLIVTATAPISLYASNFGSASYGATNVLPIEALSKEYVIQTYSYDRFATELAIVATTDGTIVSIDPKNDNIKKKDGSHYTESFSINLNKGEAYLLRGEGQKINLDLSGTVICSNHPIAVFNGGQGAIIPAKVGSDDHIVEQSLPTYMWGEEFVVTNSAAHEYSIVKITAMYDGTIIYVDNQQEIILDKKESFQFAMGNVTNLDKNDSTKKIINKNALYIKSSYPTQCFSYHTDEYVEDYGYPDPSMIFIPPLEQKINEISFLTNNIGGNETHHLVNIITKTTAVNNIKLDGELIASDFTPVPGNTLYSYARKKLDESGSHKITSTGDGFLAYAYGASAENAEAYAYNVGNNLLPLSSYMLIEGKRVNEKRFCLNDVIDISSIINYEYDNIEWYMDLDNEPNTIHYSGDSIIKHQYDTSGTYNIKMVVTKKSALCEDSDCSDCRNSQDIVKAKIIVFDTCNTRQTKYICEGESFHWQLKQDGKIVKDTIISTEVKIKETLISKDGCDSIITLTTKIVKKPHVALDSSICECETPYKFNKKLLYESGTYYDTLKTIHGCDSFITLNLTVNPCYTMPVEEGVVCGNEEFEWRNKVFKNLKVDSTYLFYDSLKTEKYNCDSVYTLELYVAPTYYFDVDTIKMCDNDVRSWDGHKNDTVFQNIKAGVYTIYDSLKTKEYGCDSIHKLTLIVYSTDKKIEEHIMCQNEIYEWRGKKYSGLDLGLGSYVFSDTISSDAGCKNIYELNLTINSIDVIDEGKDTICLTELEKYKWENHENKTFNFDFSKGDTTYILYDSLKTHLGCDSIYKIELYVAPTYNLYDTASICDGEPFTWEVTGKTYTQAGDYDTTFTSILGCDSIWHLHLKVGKKYFIEDSVKICDNEYYIWEGHKNNIVYENLKGDTTYIFYDSLKTNTFGCDSIHKLTIEVCPTFLKDEGRDSICQNKSYSWRGKVYENLKGDTTYIFYDSLKTHLGCDSIYKFELYVAPTYNLYDTASICDGEPFIWEVTDRTYTQAGDYDTTFTSILGCDSIWHLHLKVGKKYFIEDSVKICDNECYIWKGHKNDTILQNIKAGEYTIIDSLKTIGYGCDSIHQLVVNVYPTYFTYEGNDSICLTELKNYKWKNHENKTFNFDFSKGDTTYILYDSLKTHLGCDSIYKFELYVAPIFHKDTIVSICEKDSFYWDVTKEFYSEVGIYNYSAISALGCDSTFTLNLMINPIYEKDTTIRFCDCNLPFDYPGDFFENDILVKAGVYSDTLQTIHGCDSILNLTLIIDSCYLDITKATICGNEKFEFRGKFYRRTGIYDDTLKTIHNCDSIFRLDLFVQPSYEFPETRILCDNKNFVWQGDVIDKQYLLDHYTQLYDTTTLKRCLPTYAGCDSCWTLNVILCPTYFFTDTITLCSNESYKWNDRLNDTIFNNLAPGKHIFYDSLSTVRGCDSVYQLVVNVDPAYLFVKYDTICDNDFYIWEDRKNDTIIQKLVAGSYIFYDSLKTNLGCDSVYQLNLIVNATYFEEMNVSICDDGFYIFNGDTLNQSGVYSDSLLSVCNCDSVFYLNLTVNPTSDTIIYDTICCGDYYKSDSIGKYVPFEDVKITKAGYYKDTIENEYGCNYYVELYLSEIEPTKMDATILDVCADDEYIFIPYTYEGRKPIACSVKFTEEGHLQGFQDVDHKEINIEGGDSVLYIPMPYNIDRQIYPRPDYYDATIFLHNGICSDSLIMEKETFLVKYPSWITEQHWNDVISLLNDRYNGGYTFSRYQWYHNGVAIPGEDSSYIYTPLIMGDEYYAEVTRTDDGKTFETCPIYPEIVTDSVIPYPYAEIIPSVISISNPHAEIKSLEEGICSIYSCYGRYIAEYNFTPPSTEIKLPIVSGVYIVIFKTVQNNRRHIQRIVIH